MKKDFDISNTDYTELTHSFQNACANKEFKEILMKYTSSLEDAFLECQNCKKCKSLSSCKNSMPGFVYTPIVQKNIITFSYDACPKKQKELTDNEYKNNLDLLEMPKDIKDASFKDIFSFLIYETTL